MKAEATKIEDFVNLLLVSARCIENLNFMSTALQPPTLPDHRSFRQACSLQVPQTTTTVILNGESERLDEITTIPKSNCQYESGGEKVRLPNPGRFQAFLGS
ncbi:unnamed protein product [Orchesella dallaii]|uniref:Uncharacterized protein n=1 Tax=Orchesella dallaii TaxID=48710 RepID=A0ABP1S380_9HEXA